MPRELRAEYRAGWKDGLLLFALDIELAAKSAPTEDAREAIMSLVRRAEAMAEKAPRSAR
jgi:hypothetical protein